MLRLFRRKKREEKVEEKKYMLIYRAPGRRGWETVEEFGEPVSQSVAEEMELLDRPGLYVMQDKTGGGFGSVMWKKRVAGEVSAGAEERGEEESEGDRLERIVTGDLARATRWMHIPAILQKSMGDFMKSIGMTTGGMQIPEGKTFRDAVKDEIKKLDEEGKAWADSHGYAPKSEATLGTSQQITVEGKIPAALVYAPDFIDKTLEKVERRMAKWGIIGESRESVSGKELPAFPERPKVKEGEKGGGKK